MRFLQRVLVPVFVALFAISLSARGEGTLDEVLTETAESISRIQTVRAKGVWQIEFDMQGMKQKTELETSLIYERPRRLSLKSQHAIIVCDGSNVYIRIPMSRRYFQFPMKEGLDELAEGDLQGHLAGLMPDTKALLSKNPAEVLRTTIEDAQIEVLPDEALEGRDCRVLSYATSDGHGPFEKMAFRVWVDKEYGLIRRLESIPPKAEDLPDEKEEEDDATGNMAQMMRSMKIRYNLSELVVNGPVADEDFVFKAEPGDRKVETAVGLTGSSGEGPGFSRFDLSGQKAPDFSLKLLDGETFTLSAHTGSVVLIDFWATWCGPCVRALPEMKKLDEAYREKGLVVIGVSRDKPGDEEKIQKLFEKHQLAYPTGIDVDKIADDYKVRGIPCLVLVDRNGVVQGRKVGFGGGSIAALQKEIETVLEGGEISSAKPLTEAELKEMQEESSARDSWSGKTQLDKNFFRMRWEAKGTDSRERTPDRVTVTVRIPPRYLSIRDDKKLVLISPDTGETNRVVSLPEEACATNGLGQTPALLYMGSGDAGMVVGLQTHYKPQGEDARRSYSVSGVEIFGINSEGQVAWTHSLGKDANIRSVDVLPLSALGQEVLLVSMWNRFMLINAAGETLLTQGIDSRDRLDFFASDSESGVSGYLQGRKVGMFDLVIPAKTPPAQ